MDTGFVNCRTLSEAALVFAAGSETRPVRGIYAGTLIATVNGWRRVENLRLGDQVMTLDSGPVRLLWITSAEAPARLARPEVWPRLVPAGALGNRNALRLPAGAEVALETPIAFAEGMPEAGGQDFALVPVHALDGFAGITPVPQQPEARLWQLGFAEDQLICTEGEALLFCPALDQPRGIRRAQSRYQPLAPVATERLLHALAPACH